MQYLQRTSEQGRKRDKMKIKAAGNVKLSAVD